MTFRSSVPRTVLSLLSQGGLWRRLPNESLLLTRKRWRVRCAGVRAGRAAESRDVRLSRVSVSVSDSVSHE